MNRLRKLLLACAIVPLSQIALQSAARAEEGNLLLAQADPACQPGDPNCVPPEQAAPKQPEAQPQAEPERPQPEAAPPAPEPEARPEAPAPEVQPEPPKPQAEPPAPQPEPQAQPPAPQPEPEAKPQEPAPKPEAQPDAPAPQPEAERPKPAPEAAPSPEPKPERRKPHVERPAAEPEAGATTPARKPDARPQPKPDAQPESAPPQPEPTVPQPKAAPNAEPNAQPTPPPPAQPDVTPAPPPAPDAAAPGTPPPPAPDAAAPGTPPPPPAQPGDQPPAPPESAEKQAPPSALIEKLGNPGAAANEAIDRSVDQKAGNLRDVQRERRVISDEDGVRVTVEPGGRVIVQSGEQAIIRHDDRARFDREDRNFRERRTRDGGREVIVSTRDGGEVKTIYDPNGIMVQRERRDRDGQVYVLFDNRSFGPGPVDEPDWQQVVRLPPPPVYDVPRDRYRVEMRSAPPRYVEEALIAPPLVEVLPQYTLDQVIYSPDLRERVRSVDLDTITFSSGAWTVESSQVASIEAVARGIEAALRRNPNEVFLVEGYTDAVGSVVDNLSLSDRRAEAVANVLTEHYGIPPENLVTQGYGESYLKIQTEAAERANRRVTLRRITPLLSTKAQP